MDFTSDEQRSLVEPPCARCVPERMPVLIMPYIEMPTMTNKIVATPANAPSSKAEGSDSDGKLRERVKQVLAERANDLLDRILPLVEAAERAKDFDWEDATECSAIEAKAALANFWKGGK